MGLPQICRGSALRLGLGSRCKVVAGYTSRCAALTRATVAASQFRFDAIDARISCSALAKVSRGLAWTFVHVVNAGVSVQNVANSLSETNAIKERKGVPSCKILAARFACERPISRV